MLATRSDAQDTRKESTNLSGLDRAIGKDLLHNIVFVAGAELILKLAFAGRVEDALLAVPSCTVSKYPPYGLLHFLVF